MKSAFSSVILNIMIIKAPIVAVLEVKYLLFFIKSLCHFQMYMYMFKNEIGAPSLTSAPSPISVLP